MKRLAYGKRQPFLIYFNYDFVRQTPKYSVQTLSYDRKKMNACQKQTAN